MAPGSKIPTAAKKLIILDRLAAVGRGKVVYVAKDPMITKGTGTNPGAISASFDVSYDGEAGGFTVPMGALADGDAGWRVNTDTVAKYVNKDNPIGGVPTGVRVAVIKPQKLLRIVASTLGDGNALDIRAQGQPIGSVFTAYCVANEAERFCHCTEFTACAYKLVAADTGAKLVCRSPNMPDASCRALEAP